MMSRQFSRWYHHNITTSQHHKISDWLMLIFIWHLYVSNFCVHQVYERKYDSNYLGKFCGSELPDETIQSLSRHMYIRMVTDGSVQHSGFRATVQSSHSKSCDIIIIIIIIYYMYFVWSWCCVFACASITIYLLAAQIININPPN